MSVNQASQVRVRFVTQHVEVATTDAPFSLPAKLGRQGLSEVINHLLGNSEENYQTFDFIINNHLLRSPLYKFIANHRINVEDIVEIEYFPALTLSEQSESVELPAWIGSIDVKSVADESVGFAGCYDGSVKAFNASDLTISTTTSAHEDPIRAIATWCSSPSIVNVATASKDQTIKTWTYDVTRKKFVLEYLMKGHMNGVESIAHWKTSLSSSGLILSGDWAGSLAAWKLGAKNQNMSEDSQPSKKRKDNKGNAESLEPMEVKPLFVLKAHQQSVSSLCVINESSNAFTASWDHSIKYWDLDRQDCINTFNCSKVITSIDIATTESSGNMLASSHPDGKVRIWDNRLKESSGTASIVLGKTSDWVSQVRSQIISTNRDCVLIQPFIFFSGALEIWKRVVTVCG